MSTSDDERLAKMREHRRENFGFTSEPAREDHATFEDERVYRFTYNGHQETAVLSLAPHEARKLYDQLAKDFGFDKPLAVLDGRPIFEGNVLFDRYGRALRAARPSRPDFPLGMTAIEKRPEDPDQWVTDTHWKGTQVLFWSAPKELSRS